jgi:hypothetical protein
LVSGKDVRHQALAASGGAGDVHPEGLHLDLADQFGEPAAVADEMLRMGAPVVVDLRHHLEGLTEEALDEGAPLRIGGSQAEHALDAGGQTIGRGGSTIRLASKPAALSRLTR